MSSLVDRLGRALRPRYAVERSLAGGGMALVFEARDPALERRVAIKVLRPEYATARGAARFLREARTIARLSHPNVVAVHEVGEADGLFYLVMDFVEGPTLRERLVEGSLPIDQAVPMGLDVLAAVQAAHEREIIHRDVKPGNIFLLENRAVLADFGIAKVGTSGEDEDLTTPGGWVGTPGYMAPEQGLGEKASPQADLYAVGAVLYESLTGRKWSALQEPDKGDWSGVPDRIAAVLRRALRWSPDERWSDAAAFRAALAEAARARSGSPLRPAVAGAAAVIAATGLGLWLSSGGGGGGAADGASELPTADLAILPCESFSGDTLLYDDIPRQTATLLEGLPDLRVVRFRTVSRWWSQESREPAHAFASFRAERVAECSLFRAEAGYRLVASIQDRGGGALPTHQIEAATPGAVAEDLARWLLRTLHPRARQLAPWLEGRSPLAVNLYFRGERAFERDARMSAARHWAAAVQEDGAFALARWRLADIRRWLPSPPGEDLVRLYEEHGHELPPLDRQLLAARIAPPGPGQFALYDSVVRAHPLDAYATLSYGDELLHRGPIWGVPPDSALRALELAVHKDSFLAPAYDHVAHAQIRLGLREEAAATLRRLAEIAAPPEEDPFPLLLQQGYLERFEPERARSSRDALLRSPLGQQTLLLIARYGLAMYLPHAQEALGRMVVERSPSRVPQRTSGHAARGLALMALGRPAAALVQFDSLALNDGGPASRLQAAQWRLVPSAFGIPGIPSDQVARARDELRALIEVDREGRQAAQAAWTLALDAPGPAAEARRIAAAAGEPDLVAFLRALEAARAGRLDTALDRSRAIAVYDSVRWDARPFFRWTLLWSRADWFASSGRADSALALWASFEHMNQGGIWHEETSEAWSPLPHAGEVDWAFLSFARLRRAEVLAELGRDVEACELLGEVLRYWDDPEPALAEERDRVRALRRERCPGG